jgi:hypothetical protein
LFCIGLIVDDWQEMHCKSRRATPSKDEKTEHAAAPAAEEEPITAGAVDECVYIPMLVASFSSKLVCSLVPVLYAIQKKMKCFT